VRGRHQAPWNTLSSTSYAAGDAGSTKKVGESGRAWTTTVFLRITTASKRSSSLARQETSPPPFCEDGDCARIALSAHCIVLLDAESLHRLADHHRRGVLPGAWKFTARKPAESRAGRALADDPDLGGLGGSLRGPRPLLNTRNSACQRPSRSGSFRVGVWPFLLQNQSEAAR